MIDLYVKSFKEREQEKIYHQVDYAEKDIAKGFGAKWDKNKKMWFFTCQEDYEDFLNYE
jgi:hypothetical protein